MDKTPNILALDVKKQFAQHLESLTQDIRTEFLKNDAIVKDEDQRDVLAKQISDYILKDLQHNVAAVWTEENIHCKLVNLKKKSLESADHCTTKLWRPKNGDMKQQLRSISMHKKLEYKKFLEQELTKKKKNVDVLRNEVSQQRIDFDNLQSYTERLPTINNKSKRKIVHRFNAYKG